MVTSVVGILVVPHVLNARPDLGRVIGPVALVWLGLLMAYWAHLSVQNLHLQRHLSNLTLELDRLERSKRAARSGATPNLENRCSTRSSPKPS
jgi:hypothetical protein